MVKHWTRKCQGGLKTYSLPKQKWAISLLDAWYRALGSVKRFTTMTAKIFKFQTKINTTIKPANILKICLTSFNKKIKQKITIQSALTMITLEGCFTKIMHKPILSLIS